MNTASTSNISLPEDPCPEKDLRRWQYPYFAKLLKMGASQTLYMCLWQSLGKSSTMCGHHAYSFQDVMHHIASIHGLQLLEDVDFCRGCEEVFPEPVSAAEHYLTHLIQIVGRDPSVSLRYPALGFMDAEWQKQRRSLLNFVLFGKDIGLSDSDNSGEEGDDVDDRLSTTAEMDCENREDDFIVFDENARQSQEE